MSIPQYTPDAIVEINTRIAFLKELESGLLKIKDGSGKEVREGIGAIISKTMKANDESIHATLRQKLLPGEDPAAMFSELKALEGARMCMEDLLSEITDPEKIIDDVSVRISRLVSRKKDIQENLDQQEHA